MPAIQPQVVTEPVSPLCVWEEPELPAPATVDASLPVPRFPQDLADSYDLTISRPSCDMPAFRAFDRWLAVAAASRGLSCCLVHDSVVQEVIDRLQTGRLRVGFHLDYFALWHVPGDSYARLAEAIAESGGKTVNPPSRSRFFTNKANAHAKLRQHRMGVPATQVLASGAAIDASELAECGIPLDGVSTVYVKPANGFGSSGVVRVEGCTLDRLQAAVGEVRRLHPQDQLLVQRGISSPRLRSEDGGERLAYWRLIYCMGELVPFWWHKSETDHGRASYRRVSGAAIKELRLHDVLAYGRDLVQLCGLNWFSTELCASEGDERSNYQVPGPGGKRLSLVAIDYVNDQCDVDVQSRWLGGPPDSFVRHVAERFAETARARKNCLAFPATTAAKLLAA